MKKQKTIRSILSCYIIPVLLTLLLLGGCSLPDVQTGEHTTQTTNTASQQGLLDVHFIDVGQGDSTLILCGGEAMLIDAGNNDMGTTVQYYLQQQGVSHLKYVVGTHPDADHIGGLDVILYKFTWDTFFMPDITKDTKTYRDVVDTVQEKNEKITHPEAGSQYSLGGAEFTILGPIQTPDSDDSNNASIVIRLEYQSTSFLFSGDAEAEEERSILESGANIKADVYKVAHHGSAGANIEDYVKQADPQYAVISCGADNTYGHPHREVLQLLSQQGISVYRTDQQGSIHVSSDGTSLSFSTSESAAAATQTAAAASTASDATTASGAQTYILNTNTKKFHLPECSSVSDISTANLEETTTSREQLIQSGYSACKRCNP